jgi:hypothetical protein
LFTGNAPSVFGKGPFDDFDVPVISCPPPPVQLSYERWQTDQNVPFFVQTTGALFAGFSSAFSSNAESKHVLHGPLYK